MYLFLVNYNPLQYLVFRAPSTTQNMPVSNADKGMVSEKSLIILITDVLVFLYPRQTNQPLTSYFILNIIIK